MILLMNSTKMFSKTSFNPETKIWSGTVRENKLDRKKPLGDIILESLDCEPGEIAQISDNNGIHLTRADIKSRTLKIAKYIQNQGLKSGDVVASIARNTHNLAPLIFGAILNGTPVNTLDFNYGKDEFVNIFRITQPKLVFCDSDIYEVIKDALENLSLNAPVCTVRGRIANVYSVEDILCDICDGEANTFLPVKIQDTTKFTPLIICSSGTSGLPKAACISQAHLSTHPISSALGKINMFSFSPVFWSSGIGLLIGGTIGKGVRVITDEPFSAELMLRIIEQYKINYTFSPPSYMAFLLDSADVKSRSLSSLKIYICGGSYVSPAVCEEMAKYMPNGIIGLSYFMTEASTGCSIGIPLHKTGSAGQLVFNTKVKILDDSGKELGINEDGEICIKPALNFLGYYGRPDETAKILDAEGWLHSGDLGHFDEEGFLFLVDRKKDVLKYKGFYYTPTEIEEVIQSAFKSDIQQVSVCGIPDPYATDLPAACVVKRKDSKITEKDIIEHVANNVRNHKQLRGGVYFVEALPLTSSGKCIRTKVRDMAIKLYDERETVNKKL